MDTDEKDEIQKEVLVDIFLAILRDGKPYEQAITDDGRISKSTFYAIRRQKQSLYDAARREAVRQIKRDRHEIDDPVAVELRRKLQETKLALAREMDANIRTWVKIRDDEDATYFMRCNAAMYLAQHYTQLSPHVADEVPEEEPVVALEVIPEPVAVTIEPPPEPEPLPLPEPEPEPVQEVVRRSVVTLLGRSFVGASAVFTAPDGSQLTYEPAKPGVIIEGKVETVTPA